MAEQEFDTLTPELIADMISAAECLLPLAHAHHDLGKWPIAVAAWLTMVREEFGAMGATFH